ncbi:MAG: hypothetical protein ACT4QA_03935 [Panacagrimonas sp.]
MNALLTHSIRYCLLAPLAMVLLVAACSRVTAENYSKLESGMSRDEVYSLLGKPDDVTGGGIGNFTFSAEVWKGRKQTISVTFGGDKLALKSIGETDDGAK